MENSNYHIDCLPTEERRKYAERLRKYAEYFQKRTEEIDSRTVKDRLIDSLYIEKKQKKKQEALNRVSKYYNLAGKMIFRSYEEYAQKSGCSLEDIPDVKIEPLSGAAMTQSTLATGGGILGSLVRAALDGTTADELKGLSDKQQAVIYKKAFETAMELLRESDVSEEKIKSALTNTMIRISEIKEKYSYIHDDDELAQKIQDECVVELTEGIEQTSDYKKFQEHIEKTIGNSAWNKMTQNAQIFLITGELLFDQWKIYGDDIDFAPICMSVSKALEVEVSRRYFVGYIKYLKNHGEMLPPELLVKEGSGFRERTEEEFMLGNITGITGYAVYLDTQTVKLAGRLIDKNQKFLKYARTDLFLGRSEADCVKLVKKHVFSIKKVCVQYRNPSAHKQKVTKVSARECLDYMIDVKRVMGEMLDDCAW